MISPSGILPIQAGRGTCPNRFLISGFLQFRRLGFNLTVLSGYFPPIKHVKIMQLLYTLNCNGENIGIVFLTIYVVGQCQLKLTGIPESILFSVLVLQVYHMTDQLIRADIFFYHHYLGELPGQLFQQRDLVEREKRSRPSTEPWVTLVNRVW